MAGGIKPWDQGKGIMMFVENIDFGELFCSLTNSAQ